MKHFAAFAVAFVVLLSSSQAVTWITVTVSAAVQTGPSSGALVKTTLTTRKYLEKGALVNGDPDLKNYFVGFRADSGQVAVVHIPTKTVAYTINSAPTGGGTAANGTSTVASTSGSSTVSSLNVNATGFVYDKITRNADSTLKSVSRQFMGGTPGLTIFGTVRTGAKRFDL